MGAVGPQGEGLAGPPVPLVDEHDLSSFASRSPALDDWLRRRARQAAAEGHSRTFVLCEGSRVIAYYALSAGSIDRAASPGHLRRNAPDPIPIALIERLAVDRTRQGQGLGADLVRDALLRILLAADTIGIRAVVVHAIDDGAFHLWIRCGFVAHPPESRTLFLPLETLRQAL